MTCVRAIGWICFHSNNNNTDSFVVDNHQSTYFLLGDENCSLDAENSVSKKASTLSSGNSSPSGGCIQPPEHPKLGFLS